MNEMNVKENLNNYFMLYADCFLTKGYTRTMLYDVSNQRAFFIDNLYYQLIQKLKNRKIDEVLKQVRVENHDKFYDFLNQMIDNNFATIVDNPKLFPVIENKWDSPYKVSNAIIDVKNHNHDYGKIFKQLDDLLCPFIQVRSYGEFPLDKIREMLNSYENIHEFIQIEIILKFPAKFNVQYYLDILRDFKMISLTFHSVNIKQEDEKSMSERISFIYQPFNSCDSCGVISKSTMRFPEVKEYVENLEHNSCLNRKISIDEFGNIKNCPSMKKSHGNVYEEELNSILKIKEFTDYWNISKNQIQTCKDCEYRHICSDCRAYLTDDSNKYSKPLKCDYDPYTGQWSN